VDGQLESVQAVESDGQRIVRIHAQRNPDKLARIAADRQHEMGVTSAPPASS
jgi:RNA polymerase sigma-70 factor (ECF subfamily)